MPDAPLVHVAILIVSYRGEPYLRDCLRSIADAASPGLVLHTVVVDNASPDSTSSLIQTEFPQVHLVESAENRGFAGGNNLGWQYIREHLPQVKYVMLLNQDATIGPKGILPLTAFLKKHPMAASVQPAIMLHENPHLLNTAGNVSHYLGFGIKTGYRQHMQQHLSWARQIDFPSGCAVLLRRDLLEKHGLFADDLFMYLEDAQLGWKYRLLGYENWYIPHATVIHQYQFKSTLASYEHLERNRWWMLLVFYRWPTLLLLLPALLLMELGQLVYAASQGCLQSKVNSYRPRDRKLRAAERKRMQSQRVISDRKLTSTCISSIPPDELKHWALQGIANPLFTLYWKIVRLFLWW